MRRRAIDLLTVSAFAAVAALPAASIATYAPALAATPAAPASAPATAPEPYVVVIDPGHGGSPDDAHPDQLFDSGSIAFNGTLEKDLTLAVALAVRKLLADDEVKVVLTRDRDTFVEISQRMAAANDSLANLFVSLHFNSFTDAAVSGSVVLYNNDQSIPFATTMSAALGRKLGKYGVVNGGILPKTDLWVHAKMPAVTVEGGYLSNAEDAVRFGRPEVRDALARAIRDGVETQIPGIQLRKAELVAWRNAHPAAVRSTPAVVFKTKPGLSLVPAAVMLVLAILVFRFRRGFGRTLLAGAGVGGAMLISVASARPGRQSRRRRRRSVFDLRRSHTADVTIRPRSYR